MLTGSGITAVPRWCTIAEWKLVDNRLHIVHSLCIQSADFTFGPSTRGRGVTSPPRTSYRGLGPGAPRVGFTDTPRNLRLMQEDMRSAPMSLTVAVAQFAPCEDKRANLDTKFIANVAQ